MYRARLLIQVRKHPWGGGVELSGPILSARRRTIKAMNSLAFSSCKQVFYWFFLMYCIKAMQKSVSSVTTALQSTHLKDAVSHHLSKSFQNIQTSQNKSYKATFFSVPILHDLCKIINASLYSLQPRCTVFEKSELLKKSTSAYKQMNYILNYKKPDF